MRIAGHGEFMGQSHAAIGLSKLPDFPMVMM